jgi:hypothetical protein
MAVVAVFRHTNRILFMAAIFVFIGSVESLLRYEMAEPQCKIDGWAPVAA